MLPKLILRSVEFYWYWHQLLTTVDIVTKLVHSIWNSFIQKIRREKKDLQCLSLSYIYLYAVSLTSTTFDSFYKTPTRLKTRRKTESPERLRERERQVLWCPENLPQRRVLSHMWHFWHNIWWKTAYRIFQVSCRHPSFTFVFRFTGLLRQQYTGQDLLSRLRVHVRLEGEQGLRLVLWQPERFES